MQIFQLQLVKVPQDPFKKTIDNWVGFVEEKLIRKGQYIHIPSNEAGIL